MWYKSAASWGKSTDPHNTPNKSRISKLSNRSSPLSSDTNQLVSQHELWSEVTLHFLCSFAPAHLCLLGETRLKNQPQVMRFWNRRGPLKPPRGLCMGGSSNLVYPEVPLQQNHSKTSVHFPRERSWCSPEGWSNGRQIEGQISWASKFATGAILGERRGAVMDNTVSIW